MPILNFISMYSLVHKYFAQKYSASKQKIKNECFVAKD